MRTKTYVPVFVLLSFLGLTLAGGVMRSQAQVPLHSDYTLLVKSLQGDTVAVRNLLHNGVDPNTLPGSNDRGMTAVMFAAWTGTARLFGCSCRPVLMSTLRVPRPQRP